MSLIAIACSGRKLATLGEMPAIDRYNGPMWQTLRAALAECKAKPEVWVLSARYGFIIADTRIVDYNQVLNERLADKIARRPEYEPQMFAPAVERADAVMFAGGRLYRETMWKACGQLPATSAAKISETRGGIGEQRAQLRAWIMEHCR
jgi:hypothetical protein